MFSLLTNSTTTLSAPSNLADWNLLEATMPQITGYTSCSCTLSPPAAGLQPTGSPCCDYGDCYSKFCTCSGPANTPIPNTTIGVCQLAS